MGRGQQALGPGRSTEEGHKGEGVTDALLSFWCVSGVPFRKEDLPTNWANTSYPVTLNGVPIFPPEAPLAMPRDIFDCQNGGE